MDWTNRQKSLNEVQNTANRDNETRVLFVELFLNPHEFNGCSLHSWNESYSLAKERNRLQSIVKPER